MEPSVGKIVHHMSFEGQCEAAIITAVRDPAGLAHSGIVDLHVMTPTKCYARPGSSYVFASQRTGGTWHWPEREG